jgi:hypothetical protein
MAGRSEELPLASAQPRDSKQRPRRSGWWYSAVALALFFSGFGLAWVGYWAEWPWLQYTAFCLCLVSFIPFGMSHIRFIEWRNRRFEAWMDSHEDWKP